MDLSAIVIYFTESLIFINFLQILSALDETLLLLLISLPIGFFLSLLFALGRVSNNIFLSKTIASYIFIVRGTPLLVQIYLIYFDLSWLIHLIVHYLLL